MNDEGVLRDESVLPIDYAALHVCCIQLIGRDGMSPSEGDILNCQACLTRLVFTRHALKGDAMWQWDITATFGTPEQQEAALARCVVEDPPEGSGEPSGVSSELPAVAVAVLRGEGPKAPVPFKPGPTLLGAKAPDQQELKLCQSFTF